MNGLKILLMPLGTGGEAQERLHGALVVANRLKAHLRVLHTRISPQTIIPDEVMVLSRKA
ncbi:MAG: universal stress protein, partial [Rhodobacteraceae bacterium]|nr:universal stress protein [Paracoccaceae bacterium]